MAHPDSDTRRLLVVAGVIRDHQGRVLLATRPEGLHMGGLWEFPGGKVKAHESPAEALVRELAEELGVTIEVGEPITFAVHEEPDLAIVLLFFAARILAGTPEPREGQQLRWVAPAELASYPTPPADTALVQTLVREAGES